MLRAGSLRMLYRQQSCEERAWEVSIVAFTRPWCFGDSRTNDARIRYVRLTTHMLTLLSTDKKCPFTGLVSIRGRILTGTVVSTKMHRTLVIRREYLHFIPKYSRYEKRHKNVAAHVSPAFRVEEGDQVTVGQCRPLSKTVRFTHPSAHTVRNASSGREYKECCGHFNRIIY